MLFAETTTWPDVCIIVTAIVCFTAWKVFKRIDDAASGKD